MMQSMSDHDVDCGYVLTLSDDAICVSISNYP